jgi:hypothetical protein
MTKLIPLREVAHLRLALPVDAGWIADRPWLPVSHTELHLASLYFPIAVGFHAELPALGLILGPQYLRYPAVDASGKWQGGYKPIALRCFPLQSAEIGADPLSDVLVAADCCRLGDNDGIALVDGSGAPSPVVREIHRLLGLLRESRAKFAEALDRLLIANLLVPLASTQSGSSGKDALPLHVVDGARFLAADRGALSAMARHGFSALDVAVACLSSQRLLQEQYRPRLAATSGAKSQAAKAAFPPRDGFGLDEVDLVLDDGELISPADIDAMRDRAD